MSTLSQSVESPLSQSSESPKALADGQKELSDGGQNASMANGQMNSAQKRKYESTAVNEKGERLYSQAERVVAAFGGARKLSELFAAIGVERGYPGIYRWTHPRSKGGADGFVPSSAWQDIIELAKEFGVELTCELTDPKPRPYAMPITTASAR